MRVRVLDSRDSGPIVEGLANVVARNLCAG